MYEDNKFKARDRTTEEDHEWLKENYKQAGFKSAAAFLEHIINKYKNDGTKELHE